MERASEASKWVSGASEWVNGQASGQILTSPFQELLNLRGLEMQRQTLNDYKIGARILGHALVRSLVLLNHLLFSRFWSGPLRGLGQPLLTWKTIWLSFSPLHCRRCCHHHQHCPTALLTRPLARPLAHSHARFTHLLRCAHSILDHSSTPELMEKRFVFEMNVSFSYNFNP